MIFNALNNKSKNLIQMLVNQKLMTLLAANLSRISTVNLKEYLELSNSDYNPSIKLNLIEFIQLVFVLINIMIIQIYIWLYSYQTY